MGKKKPILDLKNPRDRKIKELMDKWLEEHLYKRIILGE